MLFAFSLKLASYMEPPAVMLAAAHHRRGTSVHAIKVCLECDCQHPRIQRLKSHPLVDQANEYIEGEDLASLPNLSLFVAELRFGWSSERLVEGGHASVNLRAARSRNRTEAYDSLGLRLPELKQLLENDADALHVFLECLEQARTPKQLVETMGLKLHPSFSLGTWPWDSIFRKIIYHSDPFTLYKSARAALQTSDGSAPPSGTGAPTATQLFHWRCSRCESHRHCPAGV